jgi:hypothetical protein
MITLSWCRSCLLGLGLGFVHAQLCKLQVHRRVRSIALLRESEKVPERQVQLEQEVVVAAAAVVAGEAEPQTLVQVHLRAPVRLVDAPPLEEAAVEEGEEEAARDSRSTLIQ